MKRLVLLAGTLAALATAASTASAACGPDLPIKCPPRGSGGSGGTGGTRGVNTCTVDHCAKGCPDELTHPNCTGTSGNGGNGGGGGGGPRVDEGPQRGPLGPGETPVTAGRATGESIGSDVTPRQPAPDVEGPPAPGQWQHDQEAGEVLPRPPNVQGPTDRGVPWPGASDLGSRTVESDPVDLRHGEFIYRAVDLQVLGGTPDFRLERTYGSRVNFVGPLGAAWDHNLNGRVFFEGDGLLEGGVVVSLGGLASHAMREVSGAGRPGTVYAPKEDWADIELVKLGSGDCAWDLRMPNGRRYCFGVQGKLNEIRELNGDRVTVEWEPGSSISESMRVAQATRVIAGVETHHIDFIYEAVESGGDHLIRVELFAGSGRSSKLMEGISYMYDDDHQLHRIFSDGRGRAGETYEYSSTSHLDEDDVIPLNGLSEYCSASCETACEDVPEPEPRDCDDICVKACKGPCESSWYKSREEYLKVRFFTGCFWPMPPAALMDKRLEKCVELFDSENPLDVFTGGCVETCAPDCVEACSAVPVPSCENACHDQCLQRATDPAKYKYGRPQDLAHNLTRVIDGSGKQIVSNKYGQSPSEPSFDAVVSQVIGETATPIRFRYVDLTPPEAPEPEEVERAPWCYSDGDCERVRDDWAGMMHVQCCTRNCGCEDGDVCRTRKGWGNMQCISEDHACTQEEEEGVEFSRLAHHCTPVEAPAVGTVEKPTPGISRLIADYAPSGRNQLCAGASSGTMPVDTPGAIAYVRDRIDPRVNPPWDARLGSYLWMQNGLLARVNLADGISQTLLGSLAPGSIRVFEYADGELRARSNVDAGALSFTTTNGVLQFGRGEDRSFTSLSGAPTEFPEQQLLAFAKLDGANLQLIGNLSDLSVLETGACTSGFELRKGSAGELEMDPPGACDGEAQIVPIASFTSSASVPPAISVVTQRGRRVRRNATRRLTARRWGRAVRRVKKAGFDLFGSRTKTLLAVPTDLTRVSEAQVVLTSLESIASQATADVRARLVSSVAQVRLEGLFSSFGSDIVAMKIVSQRLPGIVENLTPGLTSPWLTPEKPELSSDCHAGGFAERRLDTGEPRLTARWATHVTDPDGKVVIAYYNDAGDNIRIAEPLRDVIQAFEFDERHNLVGSARFPLGPGAAFEPPTCRTFNDRHLPETTTTAGVRQCMTWDKNGPWQTGVIAPRALPPSFAGMRIWSEDPVFLAQWGYNADDGRMLVSVNEAGDQTRYLYGGFGQLSQILHANGAMTRLLDYDPTVGEPRQVVVNATGSESRTEDIGYDDWGHVTNVTRTGWGPNETWKWTDRVRLERHATTTENGTVANTYEYTANARVKRVVTSLAMPFQGDEGLDGNVAGVPRFAVATLETVFTYGPDFRLAERVTRALANRSDESRECFWSYADGTRKRYIDASGMAWQRTRSYDGSDTVFTLSAGEAGPFGTCGGHGSVLVSRLEPVGTARFDGADRLVQQTDSAGVSLRFEYDLWGRPIRQTDAKGSRSETRMDLRGRPIVRATFAPGADEWSDNIFVEYLGSEIADAGLESALTVEQSVYGDAGRSVARKVWVLDASGELALSRDVKTVARPAQRTFEAVSVTEGGRVATTTQTFDRLGRLLTARTDSSTGQTSDEVRVFYDTPRKVRIQTRGPDGSWITTSDTYGASGLLTQSIVAGDEVTKVRYDAFGRVTAAADEAGVTTIERDGLGRVTERARRAAPGARYLQRTGYAFDERGRLHSIRTGDCDSDDCAVATYGYDNLGRVNSETRPSSVAGGDVEIRSTTYVAGTQKVDTVTLPSGRTYKHYYEDARGILTGVHVDASAASDSGSFVGPSVATLKLTPGATGQIKRAEVIVDGSSLPGTVVERNFDGVGRVLLEAPGGRPEFAVTSTYGLGLGRVTQTVDSLSTTYGFRADGRLETITGVARELARFSHVGSGAAERVTYGNGLIELREFDPRGRVTAQTIGGVTDLSLGYAFGRDGYTRQVTMTAAGETTSLFAAVDEAGRVLQEYHDVDGIYPELESGNITNEQFHNFSEMAATWRDYRYDASDNWIERGGDVDVLWLPDPNTANAYRNYDGELAVYDKDGRLLEADGKTFKYDVFGRVAEVQDAERGICAYNYDAFGRRYFESCDGEGSTGESTETYFGWDGDNLVAEKVDGHVVYTVHAGGPSTPIARVDGDAVAYLLQGTDRSVRAAFDGAGELIETYTYSAYGETRVDVVDGQSPTGNRLAYHGHVWDQVPNLYSMRARFYSPVWGRFLTQDPIGVAGGANLYAFVGNSPLDHWDPYGLEETPQNARTSTFGSDANRDLFFSAVARRNKEITGRYRNMADAFINILADAEAIPGIRDANDQLYFDWQARTGTAGPPPPPTGGFLQDDIAALKLGPSDDPDVARGYHASADANATTAAALTLLAARGKGGSQQGVAMASSGSVRGTLASRVLGRLGRYPNVVDLRTGRPISFPSGNLQKVPKAQRVSWGSNDRAAFIAEWHRRGYARPKGGWDKYDIHHIHPKQLGGTNDFWNLTPVERTTHQNVFSSFWRAFIE